MTEPWPFGLLRPGAYQVILSDPPWTYTVRTPKGEGRSASRHYRTMSLADIKALPVEALAAPSCHLFLWSTTPNLPHAFATMAAWGFTYSASAFAWVKLNKRAPTTGWTLRDFCVGMGHTTRKNIEICLLGRRGAPKRLRKDVRELVIAPRREHSRKPDEVRERIERYAEGPYVELFARSTRPGWDSWGLETELFEAAA